MLTSEEERMSRWRRAKVPCAEKSWSLVTLVTFQPWQAKEWLLPWCRLDAISLVREGESERAELFFPHHHVVMVGDNLRIIIDEMLANKVQRVRDFPASHRASLEACDPFISRLEVHALSDPKSKPADEIPF